MLLNGVQTSDVIVCGVFSLPFGLVTLFVHHKKWMFICDREYRKAKGEATVNIILILLVHVVVTVALSIVAGQGTTISKAGCAVLVAYEALPLLTFTGWFVVRLVCLEDSLRLYRWPSLNIVKACVIGYLLPFIFAAVVMIVLFAKKDLALCKIGENTRYCYLDSCEVPRTNVTYAIYSTLLITPLAVTSLLYAVQNVRMLKVANKIWNFENLTLRQKLAKYRTRTGLQRDQIYNCLLFWFLVILLAVIFLNQKWSSVAKTVYTNTLSASVIVIFMEECLMGRKDLNPFISFKEWWASKRVTNTHNHGDQKYCVNLPMKSREKADVG